ncbi:MAG: ABC transporter substrate-binding protein [Planctomycetes bacterium]|nr:ABC transporter substrate-binding protein [Planctomycetota bacterium]
MTLSWMRDSGRRAGLALALCASLTGIGAAQSTPTPRQFGVFFWHDSPNDVAAFEGIREAMTEIGRTDTFVVERAGEDPIVAEAILRGFVERGVDLIFAMGTNAALLAERHVTTIPIVFTAVTNPVESGVLDDWGGSGRNLAGNSNWIPPETTLRVFRLTVPGLRRLGVLRSTDAVVSAAELHQLREHVARPDVDPLEIFEVRVAGADELPEAVDKLAAQNVEAIWIPIDRLVYTNTKRVFEAAKARGLPIVSSSLRGTRNGATSGLVVDYVMLGKRAAAIALSITEDGVDPGSIPIGTMHGYRVVVNLEAARQCRYEIPLSLLVLADVLVETIEG